MGEPFDPYLRWLGIRDKERPPNHYRLLGVELFESDLDVIAMAADRQMAHLRTLQAGAQAELNQRILNELSAARVCLLKPERKTAYDEQLRRRMAGAAAAAKTAAAQVLVESTRVAGVPPNGAPVAADPAFPDFSDMASYRGNATGRKKFAHLGRGNPSKLKLWPWLVAAAASLALVVGVARWRAEAEPEGGADSSRSSEHSEVAQNSGRETGSRGVKTAPLDLKKGPDGKKSGEDPSKDPKQLVATRSPLQTAPVISPGTASPGQSAATVSNHEQPSGVVAPNLNTVAAPPLRVETEKPTLPQAVSPAGSALPTDVASLPAKAPAKDPVPDLGQPVTKAVVSVQKPDHVEKPKTQRLAVPSKDAQAAAEQVILGIFKADLEQANRGSAPMKIALAKKLQQQALDTPDDPAARYMLFNRAKELAAAGGDGALAFSVVDKLADRFAVDGAEEKFNVLLNLQKNARSPEAIQILVPLVNNAADQAIADDKYEVASKIVRMASGWAIKLHNPQLIAQEKARTAEIEQMKKDYGKSMDAMATLQKRPDDPEANFAIGYFVGAIKGDFEKALPSFEKGGDPAFRDLAVKELAEPTDGSAQAALADGWWNVAEDKHEPAKGHLHWHAAEWYKLALPELKGLSMAQAEARIKQAKTERPLPNAPDRIAMLRILTSGDWHLTWYGPRTNYSGTVWFQYPHMKFSRDGTFKNEDGTGIWDLDGDTITATYDTQHKTCVQRFRLVEDSLRCEHYDPPTVLASIGLGVKNHPTLPK